MLFAMMMLPGAAFAYYFGTGDLEALLQSAFITFTVGSLMFFHFQDRIKTSEKGKDILSYQ